MKAAHSSASIRVAGWPSTSRHQYSFDYRLRNNQTRFDAGSAGLETRLMHPVIKLLRQGPCFQADTSDVHGLDPRPTCDTCSTHCCLISACETLHKGRVLLGRPQSLLQS